MIDEVKLPDLKPLKLGTVLTPSMKLVQTIRYNRRPQQSNLGLTVEGAALPHPNPDAHTMGAGVAKRFASRPPAFLSKHRGKLRAHVLRWCKSNLKQLSPTTDLTTPTWLERTNYTRERKNELQEVFDTLVGDIYKAKIAWGKKTKKKLRQRYKCKSFMKDETYPAYKHSRAINARIDEFKVLVGPVFKEIENILFEHPAFIKHVPEPQRPMYIKERLYRPGGVYYATDYTSFEALFTRLIMMEVEIVLYEYMCEHLPNAKELMGLINGTITGENRCDFKWFSVLLEATRMSGEMCTSLGNGFSNLMFMDYLCSLNGAKFIGVVEGDDGLFIITEGKAPTKEQFEELGLVIEMERHENLCTASFCGIVFDETELINIKNPIEVLVGFGWSSGQYAFARESKKRALLRAKAYSLKYQFAGCPVLEALANTTLRLTRRYHTGMVRNIDKFQIDGWHKERLFRALKANPETPVAVGPLTRLLVERLYGIPVEWQVMIEEYLESLTEIQQLDNKYFLPFLKPDWVDYAQRYVVRLDRSLGEAPPLMWHKDVRVTDSQSWPDGEPYPFDSHVV